MNKIKSTKGITLISLVVTIIVLLILAGVSIIMLTGQNGIMSRAEEAKTKTTDSQSKEELEMALSQLAMEYHLNGGEETLSDYIFSHEEELKSILGDTSISLNEERRTITYKGKVYAVADDGTITSADGVALNTSSIALSIEEGEAMPTETLTATLINITGSITWTSSTEGVVEITGTGATVTITAVGEGETTITARCGEYTATCEVKVKNVTIASSLTLDKSTTTVDENETVTITATQNGTEEIEWTSSDESVAKVVGSGENKQTGTVTGIAAGTATIKAKTKNKEATCTVTVKSPYIDDSYVDYNVGYTDIYTEKEYNRYTGWRILNQKDNGDGTYDLDIISTGIPAGLYYHSSYITTSGYNIWAGTSGDVTNYTTAYYVSTSSTAANMYAASGLRYHFNLIKFKKQSGSTTKSNNEYNSGYYTAISKNGVEQNGTITGEMFIAREGATVRSVMHGDITGNDKSSDITVADPSTKPGLFILQNYTPDKHSSGYYWLASPSPKSRLGVRFVEFNGSVGGNFDSGYSGVCPVVSMTGVKMQKKADNEHVWEITN